MLGYENRYINLSNYEFNTKDEKVNNEFKNVIIRNRTRNLKNIITRILTIIHSINHKKKIL